MQEGGDKKAKATTIYDQKHEKSSLDVYICIAVLRELFPEIFLVDDPHTYLDYLGKTQCMPAQPIKF